MLRLSTPSAPSTPSIPSTPSALSAVSAVLLTLAVPCFNALAKCKASFCVVLVLLTLLILSGVSVEGRTKLLAKSNAVVCVGDMVTSALLRCCLAAMLLISNACAKFKACCSIGLKSMLIVLLFLFLPLCRAVVVVSRA